MRQGADLRQQRLVLAPPYPPPLEPEHPAPPRDRRWYRQARERVHLLHQGRQGHSLAKWSQPGLAVLGWPSTTTPSPGPTSPSTRQRGGSRVPAGNVATSEWSSPPVSTHSWARASAGVGVGAGRDGDPVRSEILRAAASNSRSGLSRSEARRICTPLASATCPRSASRPSLTSISAVAPSPAASGPAS